MSLFSINNLTLYILEFCTYSMNVYEVRSFRNKDAIQILKIIAIPGASAECGTEIALYMQEHIVKCIREKVGSSISHLYALHVLIHLKTSANVKCLSRNQTFLHQLQD